MSKFTSYQIDWLTKLQFDIIGIGSEVEAADGSGRPDGLVLNETIKKWFMTDEVFFFPARLGS